MCKRWPAFRLGAKSVLGVRLRAGTGCANGAAAGDAGWIGSSLAWAFARGVGSRIATAATEQAAASGEIDHSVSQISRSTQESSATSAETATACTDPSSLAFDLQDLVNRFQLEAKPASVQPLPRAGHGAHKSLPAKRAANAAGRK